MTLTLDENKANYQIKAYTPGTLQINEQIYTQSVIVSSEKLISNWAPQHISELTQADFDAVRELKPTILLLGTGAELVFPPIETYGALINQKIGVEVMDTRAACRTFNALSAEGRNVIAALIIK